jgi:hypothetical protein
MSSGMLALHMKFASSHFEFSSQNPMQQPKQSESGENQDRSIEEKHIKLYSEITFLRAEEHVWLVPAAVVALVHLRV